VGCGFRCEDLLGLFDWLFELTWFFLFSNWDEVGTTAKTEMSDPTQTGFKAQGLFTLKRSSHNMDETMAHLNPRAQRNPTRSDDTRSILKFCFRFLHIFLWGCPTAASCHTSE
jgi:hypothetical protein